MSIWHPIPILHLKRNGNHWPVRLVQNSFWIGQITLVHDRFRVHTVQEYKQSTLSLGLVRKPFEGLHTKAIMIMTFTYFQKMRFMQWIICDNTHNRTQYIHEISKGGNINFHVKLGLVILTLIITSVSHGGNSISKLFVEATSVHIQNKNAQQKIYRFYAVPTLLK